MIDNTSDGASTLQRIADALGLSVADLYEGTEPRHLRPAHECMRLWYNLKTDAGREAALNALRKVLDEEGD